MSNNWTEEQVSAHLAKIAGEALKTPSISEAQFQREVTKIATQLHWRWYHTHDSMGSQAGFPDLVMVRGERLFYAELKTEQGKLSKEQRQWIDAIHNANGICYLWRPSMMDMIIETLK